jgi:hypothetical protein
VTASGGISRDGFDLVPPRARAQRGRGISIACNGRIQMSAQHHVMISWKQRSWTYWTQDPLGKGNDELYSVKELQVKQSRSRSAESI